MINCRLVDMKKSKSARESQSERSIYQYNFISTPQFHTKNPSVPHLKPFSSTPKTLQFHTEKPIGSTPKTPQLKTPLSLKHPSVRHKKTLSSAQPSVSHRKPLSSTHPSVQHVSSTEKLLFQPKTPSFPLKSVRRFMLSWRISGAEKKWPLWGTDVLK